MLRFDLCTTNLPLIIGSRRGVELNRAVTEIHLFHPVLHNKISITLTIPYEYSYPPAGAGVLLSVSRYRVPEKYVPYTV